MTIKGFRGIKDLTIPKLGRATLLAGVNGAGKTTVLDAVRVFASRGSYPVLADILLKRDETEVVTDEDGKTRVEPVWDALFHGRKLDSGLVIAISYMEMRIVSDLRFDISGDEQLARFETLMVVSFGDYRKEYPLDAPNPRVTSNKGSAKSPGLICESLGPGLPGGYDLARFWDKVALTDGESRAIESLKFIFGNRIERAAFVGENSDIRGRSGRRAMVKMKGESRPVPLMSLGDGAARVWAVALALASSRDGFLLLDEVENGIHHAIQRDFWKMVMLTAHENNVQVVATTHSHDCVKGFARAAAELDDVVGLLHRIENDGGKARAVSYSETDLKIAADQGIEVR